MDKGMISPHISLLPLVETCDRLDKADFLSRFGKPGIPFLLKNSLNDTPAMQKWDWQFFIQQYGQRMVIVYRTKNRNHYQKMLFKDYIDYIQTTEDEDPLYLLDWFVDKNCPELRDDYTVPDYFNSWADKFIEALRPKFLAFYIGPKNSASPLHIDIMSTSAWNAVFRGTKLWVFYPPNQSRFVYDGKVNPFNPDYEKYPLYKHAQGMYAIQQAGDIIYTPSNWWHGVLNMENTISLTDNFINSSNSKVFINNLLFSLAHLTKRTWKRRHQQYN
jgi:histone arginine demethylase JMJD6